ncbi:hypothetical protein MGYG_07991 [Nannizzia gypsea CBS 118893]|uniref:Uncharacterized protein n=1 Tax=Arthroderma gypseum (strain ATCC MYA-4604 / CBS 118893) TaxID=535722 RepID=E4V4R4_ARTGP|nr:hypothetical protein MGYG_07991 [Nannizzia gypsea CBS 118893]EFR04988.1 hypothetical protein MGYG_07991 [Nannizzia gypsea CBS 118893]
MHFISIFTGCLLVCLATASAAGPREQPIYANVTLIDAIDSSVGYLNLDSSIGNGVVAFSRNKMHHWDFRYIGDSLSGWHVVRDSNSTRFIQFPEYEEGAIAAVTESSVSAVRIMSIRKGVYMISSGELSGKGLLWTVEPFSDKNPTRVLKLRKPTNGAHQLFRIDKLPQN